MRMLPSPWFAALALLALAQAGLPARAAADAAPIELLVRTLDHGDWSVEAHRGHWVVVNYWATWCAPCRKEMPELDALHRENPQVEVLGLAFEEIDEADMRAFLEERPVAYPISLVDVFEPPAAFEVPRGMPMTYLLDPEGRIAHRWLGPVTREDIEARIVESGD
jgi:thiol-disulfide isomerase/thioredoxin